MSHVEEAIGLAVADLCTPEHTQLSSARFARGVGCALPGCCANARTLAFLPHVPGWSFLCRNHAMDLYTFTPLWPEVPA